MAGAGLFAIPTALIGTAAAVGLSMKKENQAAAESKIPPAAIEEFLLSEIKALKGSLSRKKALVKQTQEEINDIENKIIQYQSVLDGLNQDPNQQKQV